ncbi:MAG: hypothetical protein ABI330_06065, partial [Caldimonas sp.]
GAGGRMLLPAAAGALLALGVVVLLGLWLHKPLANVPENALKFGVGVMLAAFGTFWVGEGVGFAWPGADWALLILIAAFLLVAAVLVPLCRRLQEAPRPAKPVSEGTNAANQPGALTRVWNELAGLFVDDGYLATGVVVWVAFAWTLNAKGMPVSTAFAGAVFVAGMAMLLALSALRRARQQ